MHPGFTPKKQDLKAEEKGKPLKREKRKKSSSFYLKLNFMPEMSLGIEFELSKQTVLCLLLFAENCLLKELTLAEYY